MTMNYLDALKVIKEIMIKLWMQIGFLGNDICSTFTILSGIASFWRSAHLNWKWLMEWKLLEIAMFAILSISTAVYQSRIRSCVVVTMWGFCMSRTHLSWSGCFTWAFEQQRLINMGSAGCDRLKDGVSQPLISPYLHQTLCSFTLLTHHLPSAWVADVYSCMIMVTEVTNCCIYRGGRKCLVCLSDLETFSIADMFWMFSLVWFWDIMLLTRYNSLFIQESWRWLGNSVQPLKIDSCFLSADFGSACWAFPQKCESLTDPENTHW